MTAAGDRVVRAAAQAPAPTPDEGHELLLRAGRRARDSGESARARWRSAWSCRPTPATTATSPRAIDRLTKVQAEGSIADPPAALRRVLPRSRPAAHRPAVVRRSGSTTTSPWRWPPLRPILTNNFVRGAVSGLGVVNLVAGFADLAPVCRRAREPAASVLDCATAPSDRDALPGHRPPASAPEPRRSTAAPRLAQARCAVDAGVDLIQVRERDLEAARWRALVARARSTSRAARATRVVVNDRLDVALACGADGVHLRGDSMPVARGARASRRPGFWSADRCTASPRRERGRRRRLSDRRHRVSDGVEAGAAPAARPRRAARRSCARSPCRCWRLAGSRRRARRGGRDRRGRRRGDRPVHASAGAERGCRAVRLRPLVDTRARFDSVKTHFLT